MEPAKLVHKISHMKLEVGDKIKVILLKPDKPPKDLGDKEKNLLGTTVKAKFVAVKPEIETKGRRIKVVNSSLSFHLDEEAFDDGESQAFARTVGEYTYPAELIEDIDK